MQTKDREAGSLSLVFSDVPLELRQWTVTDQQGIQTRISLNDTRYGGRIDPELFRHDQAKIDSPRN
ncbi:MAG: outer-membrane lipoprotein carrier protein LolA [Alphaproteobacteria bacterium]|nr:outer-membrane lipoprotein carrier protein LolA [Alphaproteobacteria bacterium]